MLTSLGGYNQVRVPLFLFFSTFRHRYGIGRDQYASGQPEIRSRNRFLRYGCFASVESVLSHIPFVGIFRIFRKHVAAARRTLQPWLRYLLPRYIGRTRGNNCQGQNPADAIWVAALRLLVFRCTPGTHGTRARVRSTDVRVPPPPLLAASSLLFLSLPSLSSISVHCDDSARLVISL